MTSQRPRLRWALPNGADGARVQICRDRACSQVVSQFDVAGESGAPAANLPSGVMFWRLYARAGNQTGEVSSRTWQFTVGARSAAVDTAWGATTDVNGDGFADVVVGSYAASYVYLGTPTGLSPTPDLTLDADSVSTLGDVNGDGFTDILASDSVFLGGTAGLSPIPATVLTLRGPFVASSICVAGDVNGDGYADLVTTTAATDIDAGAVHTYLGSAAGLPFIPSTTMSTPDIVGAFDSTLAGVGDVNGDGYADIVLAVWSIEAAISRLYVYRGGQMGLEMPSTAVLLPGGSAGLRVSALSAAGDVNGDGYADVVVGSEAANRDPVTMSTRGGAFVYLGTPGGLSTVPSATLIGVGGDDVGFGSECKTAGDVNGDGFADIVIGSHSAGAPPDRGRGYLYLGGFAGIPATPSITMANISDPPVDSAGFALADGRDLNGDGFADILAVSDAFRDTDVRQVHVYLGSAANFPISPSFTLMTPDTAGGRALGFGASLASLLQRNIETEAPGFRRPKIGSTIELLR